MCCKYSHVHWHSAYPTEDPLYVQYLRVWGKGEHRLRPHPDLPLSPAQPASATFGQPAHELAPEPARAATSTAFAALGPIPTCVQLQMQLAFAVTFAVAAQRSCSLLQAAEMQGRAPPSSPPAPPTSLALCLSRWGEGAASFFSPKLTARSRDIERKVWLTRTPWTDAS